MPRWWYGTPRERDLLKKLIIFQLVKKLPAFNEPEGSLPYLKVHATCPYSQPDQLFCMGVKLGPHIVGVTYEGEPKNNRSLNVTRELEVVARCAARCHESTQYSSSLSRGVSLG